MKALLVFSLMIIVMPLSFFLPFEGLIAYVWVAYLRPHEWAYMPTLRLQLAVAVATVAGYALFELPRRWPCIAPNALLILLWAQLMFSTFLAQSAADAQPKFIEFSKTFLIAVLMTTMTDSESRVRRLLLGTVCAFGLLASRSIVGIIRSGGARHAFGPGGMFEDNNDYALLLVTALPLVFYCARAERQRWLRWLCYWFAAASFITIFFTRSRGGFVGLCVMLLLLSLQGRHKLASLTASLALVLLMLAFVPAAIVERLGTIQTARQSDQSAQARLRVWGISLQIIADHPLAGVGSRNILKVYERYGEAGDARVSHNAFLQIGVDAGLPALLLFVSLLGLTYLRLWRARRTFQMHAPESPLIKYTYGLQAALAGYCASAMFVSRHDFELVYQIAALATSLLLLARGYEREAEMRELVAAQASLQPNFAR